MHDDSKVYSHLHTLMWFLDPDARASGRTYVSCIATMLLGCRKIDSRIPIIDHSGTRSGKENMVYILRSVLNQSGIKHKIIHGNSVNGDVVIEDVGDKEAATLSGEDWEINQFAQLVKNLRKRGFGVEDIIEIVNTAFVEDIMDV